MIFVMLSVWQKNPALLYGLSLFLGISCAFFPSWILLIPSLLLFLSIFIDPEPPKMRRCYILLLALLLSLSGFFYAKANYQLPQLPQEGLTGKARVTLDPPSRCSRHYGRFWCYHGRLQAFQPNGSETSIAHNLPFVILLPEKSPRLNSGALYEVDAQLLPSDRYPISFKTQRHSEWNHSEWGVVGKRWTLGEWRFQAKERVARYISSHMNTTRSATFLTGLATGEFDDRRMLHEFGRFGLQHVMAISGFHFSLVAGFLAFFMRLFLPPKRVVPLLLVAISSYFLFIGPRPSVMRAWITIVVGLGGTLIGRQTQPLNLLGVALLVVLLYDPLLAQQIGFQFSFLATAAILLFYQPIEALLHRFSPVRPLSTLAAMDRTNQHGYLLLQWAQSALALSLAVHLVTVPFLLAAFHQFPLLSLLYNLFFPFLVSFALLLLLVAPLFPPLHALNNFYCDWLLGTLYQTPTLLDFTIRCRSMSLWFLVGYLSFIFFLGFWLQRDREERFSLQFF